MNRKGLGLVGGLAAASAISRMLSPAAPRPLQADGRPPVEVKVRAIGATEGAAACPSPEDGPWSAACVNFALSTSEGWRAGNTAALRKLGWSCVPPKAPIEFLIATVADPQTTHLALYFDRTVESLTWALTDAGYVFQNAWLPWTVMAEKGLSALSDINCQKGRLEALRDQPGLLVFRPEKSAPAGNAALFVFLVAETPTGGVHKIEFSNAVNAIRTMRPGESTVRVVGPNFSGSFRPLADDILAMSPAARGLKFQFVTGVATNGDAAKEFTDALTGNATLESVIENDERAGRLFLDYLDWHCRSSPRTALLSEDETVYGTFLAPRARQKRRDEGRHHWLALTYPRDIATLRNAYQEDVGLSDGKAKAAAEGAQQTLKDVPDSDTLNERDTIPAFSPRQGPASQQAMLSGIAANLRRERVDFTGIVATDVLDNLFLTRFLRVNAPDVRIVSLDADLLFPWEAETSPFGGVLSVTTYSLIGRNQHWTQAELPNHVPRRVVFASRSAEGTYNACSRIIYGKSGRESLLEYCHPIQPAGRQPPLWLTVVGRDGYWPVALLDDRLNDAAPSSLLKSVNSPEIEPYLHPEYPPRAWYLCFWLVLLFCWMHCIYLWRLLAGPVKTPLGPPADWRGRMRQIGVAAWDRLQCLSVIFKAYPSHKPDARECPFLVVATLSAACVVVVLTVSLARFLVPYQPVLSQPMFWAPVYAAFGAFTTIALFSTAIALHSPCYRQLVYPSWGIAIVFCGTWIYLNVDSSYQTGLFFAYRNLNIGSGVSAALPVLLLGIAYYGWSWVHLKREGEIVARCRFRGSRPPTLPKTDERVIAVDDVLENIFSARLLVPAVLFIMLWFLLFTPWRSLRSLEHWPYDLLYGLLQAILYWAMAVAWMQFILSWNRFQRFLQWLERQPIRNSFSRLRKEISWVPLVTKPGEHPLFISTRELDCLNAIMAFEETGLSSDRATGLQRFKSDQKAIVEQIEQDLKSLDGNLAASGSPDPATYTNLQIRFERVGQAIAQELEDSVWKTGESDSLQQEMESKGEKNPLSASDRLTILEEEFIALRYLMFLRYVFRQLRNLLGFIVGGFILSVISFSSYPFQGHRTLSFGSLIAFLALGIGIGIVFAEMDRDAILSRITDTKTNEVGKTFFFRLLQYGSLPLLTLLASQFSWVNHAMFSWIQPMLEALH